ncbi:oxaloacetate decarboxylase, alpha subunit, putative [Campylobacter jejuni subsp. jejuni HN-CJD07035]|uniref:biotin/lipoyl-containing protein n=1 Tax=Campylobacter jejuni TaxID=197 RepID=UPI000068DA8B|nr:biotin/lipoyl-containing protein [Campylobacter jejuni]ADT66241.1 oxaloacetate decarboxylase, alpha subunit, putative [Campylobacter jejuni subsp. jejuni ICDCCJ07001]ALF91970.1 pyruvate carboxylase, subunit B [Campylobacter jejuni subsp. jejuni]ALF93606.1 pyruvate carboxylase, subunit B [Campylobacter jejuni subsp. jejuni]EAJ7463995.1 biotin attachment protein [Campylobacter jejuni]EAK1059557.1 biotin attachment protein [Campylobacter jejuni]
MAKKFIDVMDTSFRDGFQSVYGARVLMDDFFPAVEAAKEAGITHFEFGGGARFQSLYFYLNEDAFTMMDRFRAIVGKDANLQTLARGVNTVTLDTGSSELIDLHAKLFAKHGTTTIRNFDALNDINNLKFSGECIAKHGLKHEITITLMDLPPNCKGAHDVPFYEKILKEILAAEIPFHSICFKDASGTSNPNKIYETIKMARKILPQDMHIRLHTHETAGVSIACYLAALEAGVDGIDLAAAPVSGGTSQPDILTMMHALKGKDYDLGGLEEEKILKYEEVLKDCLKEYFLPPEATMVNPLIPFSPMPGGALTANTQMMRDNNILDKFPQVIHAMREVVEKGGFGTSVTPVSQFYFQQAFNNVMFGSWKKIAEGYGKMVLGYFGKTPVAPDANIIELASKQLNLEPTTELAINIADKDESKSIAYTKTLLEKEGIETSEENIFVAAACKEKGIAFLKGEAKVNIRKLASMPKPMSADENKFTVAVNGNKYHVEVSYGFDKDVNVKSVKKVEENKNIISSNSTSSVDAENEVLAGISGNVFKIYVNEGEEVKSGQAIMVLEAMKMEIEVNAPKDGIISELCIKIGDTVNEGEVLAIYKN